MKKVILFLMMLLFTAGLVAQSAYAFSCPYVSEMAADSIDDGLPCHDEGETQTSHCDGVCLCSHFSVNQNVALQNSVDILIPNFLKASLMMEKTQVSSISPPLLFRPPIAIS